MALFQELNADGRTVVVITHDAQVAGYARKILRIVDGRLFPGRWTWLVKESILMSWANIVNNKLRSALTMLGIVIGVASIIALITIVQGATGAITDEISSLGANILTVQARGTPLKPGLSANDLDRLEAIADVRGVSPTISGYVSVSHRDKVLEAMVQGKNELYFRERPVQISAGRAINALDVDGANRVAVIGSDIAGNSFTDKTRWAGACA